MAVLPLRPLTVGELLDAAVALLHRHARPMLVAAVGLAALEQALLYPLRLLAQVQPPGYFPPHDDRIAAYWLMLSFGLATEATVVAALGGLAARAATGVVLTRPAPGWRLLDPRRGRVPLIALLALVVGAAAGLGAFAGYLPWLVAYGLLGLAVPALVIDETGPLRALGRSVVLSVRHGLRALWVRLVGYLVWLLIRSALAVGGLALVEFVASTDQWIWPVGVLAWILVNAIAYSTLACLDAVLHLETRMRTEGLDIWLARAARHQLTPATLAVHRG